MAETEIIDTLACAVARLLCAKQYDGQSVQLGPGGTIVEVDDSGQVCLDGCPVGRADEGFRHTESLVSTY